MKAIKSEGSGFSSVEVVMIILVIVIIGSASFYVFNKNIKKPLSSLGSSKLQPVDVYAGWKLSCDNTVKLCFRYPPEWSVNNQSNSAGIVVTVINAKASADAQYGNVPTTTGVPTSVYTSNPLLTTSPPPSLVVDLSNTYNFNTVNIAKADDKRFKVVGGYYASANENIPSYLVVTNDTITKLGLVVGQTSKLQANSFNIYSPLLSNNIILFGAGPITNNSFTITQAASWFSSFDGKITLQVAKSFYLKK
jgi:hypothetical protein